VKEKLTNKHKKNTEIEIRRTDRKPEFVEFRNSEFVEKKANLNSGFGNMQISDNNMEIRSIQFHVLFPPDCFFFQEFFFMGGAIHPFPKIMRGEIAFFRGGWWCNSPLPKNYEG